MPRTFRRVHCKYCDKEMGANNVKRHEKTCKRNPTRPVQVDLPTIRRPARRGGGRRRPPQERPRDNHDIRDYVPREDPDHAVIDEEAERAGRKGNEFFMTFQKPIKYHLVKKIVNPGFSNWLKGFTVSNEWGCAFYPDGHCHALLSTQNKYNFDQIKKILKDQYNIVPNDIQAPKNKKQVLRYITKEDYKCFSTGHDKDDLSLITRAYLFYRKCASWDPTRYPYCHLPPWQQKQFKEFYEQFLIEDEMEMNAEYFDNWTPHRWQRQVEHALLMQTRRQVLWIYDPVGGRGKTELSNYLCYRYGALVLSNSSTKDIAYAYQKHVIFDYARTTQEHVNYEVIEQLKNGRMFSSKYNSKCKVFPSAKVLCLANFLPDYTGLSSDRYHVLEIYEPSNRDVRLRRVNVAIPVHPQPLQLPTIELSSDSKSDSN